MKVISIKDITKKFGWFFSRRKVLALDGLTMDVPDNVIFGFLGPNGAGKTTTIKILLGLILPTSGESRIFNVASNDRDVRERVGFLPDNPKFYNHLTAREFLHFCGKLIHLNRMERSRRTDELLERMGLRQQADQKLDGFSRGQQQRLGIAQALLNNPDLIILDEPITGLDPMGRREVKEILKNLRDEGKTVFFSSHILSDVEQMCDMVSIINRGQLIEYGRCEDLLGEREVIIWADGIDPKGMGDMEKLCDSITMKNGLTGFTLSSSVKKQEVVSTVKSKGGDIKDIETKRDELEDFFLRRVTEDNKLREQKGVL
jgi:ABC-2 type transport system ATP-binding protein